MRHALLSYSRPCKAVVAARAQRSIQICSKNSFNCKRTSLLAEISDESGSLHDILRYFSKYNISITHIESRPIANNPHSFQIALDFEGKIGEERTENMIAELRARCSNAALVVLEDREVPWFPRHISELTSLVDNSLSVGAELNADHPGFHDAQYRQRREQLAAIARSQQHDLPAPRIEYTPQEIATWGSVYSNLKALLPQYACEEYILGLQLLEQHCDYSERNIPQVADISQFLRSRTGFQLRPVTGLLTSRDFLNGLAFRTFFSTQYIRHHSRPLYTPEPDICHELLGHVPMFADPDFADFSQEIGLASLGASEEEVVKLASCYWFSVEFGLLRAQPINTATTAAAAAANNVNTAASTTAAATESCGGVRAYGAGLLSSFGELQYACGGSVFYPPATDATTVATVATGLTNARMVATAAGASSVSSSAAASATIGTAATPLLLPWDPAVASVTSYPVTCYQPTYFVAESLADAKQKMRAFCQQLRRPFHARYDALTRSIWVDRAVKPSSRSSSNESSSSVPIQGLNQQHYQ